MFRLVRYCSKTAVQIQSVQVVRNFTRSSVFRAQHKVNNLEKKFLVWTGKFKSVEEVPTFVAGEMVEKARNKMRIRLANSIMALTLLACLFMSLSGKRARDRGESVQKENLAWHNQYKEDMKNKE